MVNCHHPGFAILLDKMKKLVLTREMQNYNTVAHQVCFQLSRMAFLGHSYY